MQTLDRIRGQDQVLDQLRRAMNAGRLHHALLFVGAPGAPERDTALALAAALQCPTTADGCGACASCEKVAANQHPDVITLEPAGAGHVISVGSIRDFLPRLAFAPHEGAVRVVIVVDAHHLNLEAANALLKTLEEPPPRTHFILVTRSPEQLPLTVRSRCQRIRFTPGEADDDESLEARLALRNELMTAVATGSFKSASDVASRLGKEKQDVLPVLALLCRAYLDAALRDAGAPAEVHVPRQLDSHDPHVRARQAHRVHQTQTAILGNAHPQLALEAMLVDLTHTENHV